MAIPCHALGGGELALKGMVTTERLLGACYWE
jgi:hypothetical protein